VSVVGIPGTAPGGVTAVSAVAGDSSASVSWTGTHIQWWISNHRYVVKPFIGATAQPVQTFDSTATTEAITGLANGTSYRFQVAAKNTVGPGPTQRCPPL